MNTTTNRLGFTLTELMIAVAIVAVLAAVAIPSYQSYIIRSYLSEATTSIASIKSAEESYMSTHQCYTVVDPWPAAIPAGNSFDWASPGLPASWSENTGLGIRPDRRVRFQYQVYASHAFVANSCGTTYIAPISTALDCVSNPATTFFPTSLFPANSDWFLVVARGDLNGDGTNSTILSAVEDSAIIMCNELE